MPETRPLKVFLIYAQKDKKYLHMLRKHLSPLVKCGLIDLWHNLLIKPGADSEKEITKALKEADIYLFLVSIDLLGTDDINTQEIMEIAIAKCERGEAIVVPIIIRACYWDMSAIGKFKPLPTNGMPLLEWASADEALFDVVGGIKYLIENLANKTLAEQAELHTEAKKIKQLPHKEQVQEEQTQKHIQNNYKNTLSNSPITAGGNVNIGDTIHHHHHQLKDSLLRIISVSIFKDEDNSPKYKYNTGDKLIISPINNLQSVVDWPGRYRQEFPLSLDIKIINEGDRSIVVDAVELHINNAYIDEQPAIETNMYITDSGILTLCLRNFGWAKNKIISFNLFNEKLFCFIDKQNIYMPDVNYLDNLKLELPASAFTELKQLSDNEFEKLLQLHRAKPYWTPNPFNLLFDDEFQVEENDFSEFRKLLIKEKKIIESAMLFGEIELLSNGNPIKQKINWGYVSYQGTSYDIIKTQKGLQLFQFQEPLAYMPPSMTYDIELSTTHKGKSIFVDTSHFLRGNEADRFVININPKECLFVEFELLIISGDTKVLFNKKITANLIKYKK